MICAWDAFLSVLPSWMRKDVDILGKQELHEVRLRINAPPELVMRKNSVWLKTIVAKSDIRFCINAASQYSPWTAETIAQGFLTIRGGHRIGICGEAIIKDGRMTGFREISSLCIRIARDFMGIGNCAEVSWGSFLIIGAPGWGKTTLLRDCIRNIAQDSIVSVIDERGELFPEGFITGKKMDILSGCDKTYGIETVLRSMGPEYIAVDEITAISDTEALIRAFGCGVKLAATAHASSMRDFKQRRVYRELIELEIFDTFLILQKDQTYRMERTKQCS